VPRSQGEYFVIEETETGALVNVQNFASMREIRPDNDAPF
jgi:hypothetical protein